MLKRKKLVIIIALLISFIIHPIFCNAIGTNYMGDLNNDLYFNSLDLSLFRKELRNDSSMVYSEVLDINVDGIIDIKDLVRMKKYLVGDVTHVNESEQGFSWCF